MKPVAPTKPVTQAKATIPALKPAVKPVSPSKTIAAAPVKTPVKLVIPAPQPKAKPISQLKPIPTNPIKPQIIHPNRLSAKGERTPIFVYTPPRPSSPSSP